MRTRFAQSLFIAVALVASCSAFVASAQTTNESRKFTNPVLPTGPDPWVTSWNGFFYYMNSTRKSLTLWKTKDLSDLRNAEKKVVWTPEPGKAWSHDTWAPELHRWGTKWYIYFAADAGKNESHRIYVVENSSNDPMGGEWTLKGKVSDATDRWAIDADIFEVNGAHYMLWSGWKGAENGEQDLFIARMSNPWTIDSPRTLISAPTYAWETIGEVKGAPIHVNEGPEALVHGKNVFVVYSASGCWTDSYQLGVLQASIDANLLDAGSWKRFDHSFFHEDADAGVYAPGHNGFFKSADGKEDWIIYHANSAPGQGCEGKRSPRIQRFTWNADGTPDLGTPARLTELLDKPSK